MAWSLPFFVTVVFVYLRGKRMSKSEEYLVNLDVDIIENVITSAGLTKDIVSSKALFKPDNYLSEKISQKTMPKPEYILLCDFFKVSYSTFSSDGKYVFAKNDTSNTDKVKHEMTPSAKIKIPKVEQSTVKTTRTKTNETICIDKNELNVQIKAAKINKAEFCLNHNRSAGYINICMKSNRMNKKFYEALMQTIKSSNKTESIIESKIKKTRKKKTTIKVDPNYGKHIKELVKKTGLSAKELSIKGGRYASYISYCIHKNCKLDDKVYNMLLELAGESNKIIESTSAKVTDIPKANSVFNEVVPEKIDLVKVIIDNKSYILINEEKFNKLIASLTASTEMLEYVGRLAKESM